MLELNNILIGTIIFGAIELILVCIFWFTHLRHHQQHIIYRIRHATFWMISLCVASTFPSIRSIAVYLFINNYISNKLLIELQLFLFLTLGFSFPFARAFFLWYALKLQRYKQHTLTKRFINSDCSTKPQLQQPFLYKHADFFQPKKIFIVFESILFAIVIIHTSLSATNTATLWTDGIHKVLVATVLLSFLLIISSLWCCRKTFRDDFKFRLEMTLLVILLILGFTFIITYNNNILNTVSNYEYQKGFVISCVVSLIVQTIVIFIQIIIPYLTLQKNIRNFSDNKNVRHIVSLLDILRHKYGFFLFMDQLCQEISFENLAYLIALHQFKYITNDDIEEYQKRNKFKSYLRKRKRKEITQTKLEPLPSNSIHSNESNISNDALSLNMFKRSNTLESFDQYSYKKNAIDVDQEYYIRILCKMPWNELPMSEFIFCHSKLKQAEIIYNKYIDRNAFDSVNCSSHTFNCVENQLILLKLWKERSGNVKCDNNKKNDVENLELKIELDEIDNIKNETQWNELLLNVFDCSLPEIFDNLDDSMTRFRYTKEFMDLTQSN